MSKSFTLAAGQATGYVEDALPFQMEGRDEQLYAYPPSEGQMVLLMGVMTAAGSGPEAVAQQAATVMDVFWSLLDEESAGLLRHRLQDREDPFGLQDVMNIIEWLVEETAARPTPSSRASTSSRATSGQRSTGTAPRRASTRSRSPRPVSAT